MDRSIIIVFNFVLRGFIKGYVVRYIFCFVFMFVSASAFSQNQYQWKEGGIKTLYPEANGNFIIVFDSGTPSCLHADGYFRVAVNKYGVTQEAANNFYSLALMAAVSGRKIMVNFDTTSSNCYINRMLVNFSQ